MTNEHKGNLTVLCKIEIKRWKAASESNPNMRYMVELMEIALASLEAEPEYNTSDAEDVHLDVSKAAFDRCHPDYRWVSYTAPPVPEDWKQRAEAAEAAVDTWRKESAYNLQGKNDAREYIRELEGKLEALEKQQPVAWLVLNSSEGYVERNPDVVANLEGAGLTKCKPLYLGP